MKLKTNYKAKKSLKIEIHLTVIRTNNVIIMTNKFLIRLYTV